MHVSRKERKGRVLVTGATGFIGHFVPQLLLDSGYEVHLLVRNTHSARAHWPGTLAEKCVFHEVNLLTGDGWEARVVEIGATHLMHLAWVTTPGIYWTSAENMLWLSSSLRLLNSFASGGGFRAVLAGTCAEYDWNFHTLDEIRTPIAPTTLYGITKAALSTIAIAGAKSLKLSVASGAVFLPYGPRENTKRLLPEVICALLAGGPVYCSEGSQVRDFIYVEDASAAFVALLNSEVEGRVNIGSGIGCSVREIVSQTSRMIGRPELVQFGGRKAAIAEPPHLIAATTRLNRELSFTPHFTLQEGLIRTIDWWRKNRVTPSSTALLAHQFDRHTRNPCLDYT